MKILTVLGHRCDYDITNDDIGGVNSDSPMKNLRSVAVVDVKILYP